MQDEITITLFDPQTGNSEAIPVASNMSVLDLVQMASALLSVDGGAMGLHLVKDANSLSPSQTLQDAGVQSGDLLSVLVKQSPATVPRQSQQQPAAAPASSAGLDFSNLLGGSGTATTAATTATASTAAAAAVPGGLNFSNLQASSAATAGANPNSNSNSLPDNGASHIPVYYSGMTLDDAMQNNPHPNQIVQLLKGPNSAHLYKEFNHHNPVLAQKIQTASFEKAVQIWREHAVQTGIRNAMRQTQLSQKKEDFKRRLQQNPNDAEAKEYFTKQENQKLIEQQYFQAMQEYPESMTKVLMLYVESTINGHSVPTFVDSGAQVSVMSKSCARKCGLLHLVDTRFAGYALGVGKSKILGRVHVAHLEIASVHFPLTITVLDNEGLPADTSGVGGATHKDMDFLLGLDMLKRHQCTIDVEKGVLRFRLHYSDKYLETPFLHEKDLDESKGGTKGFNAEKSNKTLLEMQHSHDKKGDKNDDEDNDTGGENIAMDED